MGLSSLELAQIYRRSLDILDEEMVEGDERNDAMKFSRSDGMRFRSRAKSNFRTNFVLSARGRLSTFLPRFLRDSILVLVSIYTGIPPAST